MKLRRITTAVAAAALTTSALAVATGPANAGDGKQDGKKNGTVSLAEVLAADGGGFDKNPRDFDILDNAVGAVLAADPKSPVSVLADGKVRLTAFAPTDGAFRRLAEDLTGKHIRSEKRVFNKLARTAGVDAIESILLYHVVPGATITYKEAKKSDGARLATALEGAKIKVKVRHGRVFLVDRDRDDKNAFVIPALKNINKGNKQIAHGVSQVLRPIDL